MPGKICPQCGDEYEINQKFCSRDGAALTTPVQGDSLEGRIVAGRYQVLRKLGEGGMGQVYLAEHVRMKRKVALKVMRPQLATHPDAISRFNREATNASRIDHPNVAAVFDFGDAEDGLIYLAMEYVDGQSLSALLTKSPTISPTRAADITRQVADALQAAHDQGIWHRDLKPDNIMLRRTKTGGDMVKVVDFGISKVGSERDQDVTTSGALIGTPKYMSPEQFQATPLDGRSDVFSLGLVAFKMLAGVLPFAGETGVESMAARFTDQPRRLSDARRGFDFGVELEAVMVRVLATDREQRYSTAPDFAREFEHAVRTIPSELNADVVTLTFPPPAHAQGDHQDRRGQPSTARAHPVRTAAIAIGAVLATIGAVVATPWALSMQRTKAPGTAAPQHQLQTPAPTDVSPATQVVKPNVTDAGSRNQPGQTTQFSFASPVFRIRVIGLPASSRERVASAVQNVMGVRLADDASESANLVIQSDPEGLLTVLSGRGEERLPRVRAGSIRDALLPVVLHDVAELKLSALDTPESDNGITFQFADGKRSFAVGDSIRFRVRSNRGGYLTIVDLSPDGEVTLLYPNSEMDIGRFAPNTEVVLPGPADVQFPVTLPAGAGEVRAIMTDAPLGLKWKGRFATSKDDPALVDKVRRGLERLVRGDGAPWSTHVLRYSVHQ